MTARTCPRCGQPVTDTGTLCWPCTYRLRAQLVDVPGLLAELDTAAWRQATMPASATTAPDCDHADNCGCGVSLPWNPHARNVRDGLAGAVNTWARLLLDDYAPACEHTSCRNDARPVCAASHRNHELAVDILGGPPPAWLASHVDSIRMRPWADDMAADLGRRTANGWQAVDRHEDRFYAGPCGGETRDGAACTRRLWARPEQAAIKCLACGALWQVADRQAWLLAAAEDLELPASEIATALTLMRRERVTAANIRQMASRGQLTRCNPDHETRPRYRVGDVLERLKHPTEEITAHPERTPA